MQVALLAAVSALCMLGVARSEVTTDAGAVFSDSTFQLYSEGVHPRLDIRAFDTDPRLRMQRVSRLEEAVPVTCTQGEAPPAFALLVCLARRLCTQSLACPTLQSLLILAMERMAQRPIDDPYSLAQVRQESAQPPHPGAAQQPPTQRQPGGHLISSHAPLHSRTRSNQN